MNDKFEYCLGIDRGDGMTWSTSEPRTGDGLTEKAVALIKELYIECPYWLPARHRFIDTFPHTFAPKPSTVDKPQAKLSDKQKKLIHELVRCNTAWAKDFRAAFSEAFEDETKDEPPEGWRRVSYRPPGDNEIFEGDDGQATMYHATPIYLSSRRWILRKVDSDG